jgi:hypothetical protein
VSVSCVENDCSVGTFLWIEYLGFFPHSISWVLFSGGFLVILVLKYHSFLLSGQTTGRTEGSIKSIAF